MGGFGFLLGDGAVLVRVHLAEMLGDLRFQVRARGGAEIVHGALGDGRRGGKAGCGGANQNGFPHGFPRRV